MVHNLSTDCTVLIPTLNIDSYLLRSVLSVVNSGAHITVVHDGGFVQNRVLAELEKLKVEYILNGQCLGVATRLNQGLSFCKTRHIARLDSDDVSLPNRLQVQQKFMVDSKADFSFGEALNRALDGSYRPSFKRPSFRGEAMNPTILLAGNPIVHPTVMFRADWLLAVGGYPSSISEDYALWIKGALTGAVGCHINRNMIIRARHRDQISNRISVQTSANELIAEWKALRNSILPNYEIDDFKVLSQILSLGREVTTSGYIKSDTDLIRFFSNCHKELAFSEKGQKNWIWSQIAQSAFNLLHRR